MRGVNYAPPELREGDTVMVCKHLWDRRPRSTWRNQRWLESDDPFIREDGTEGQARFWVFGRACSPLDKRDVDFVEFIAMSGALHVANFHRCPECERAKSS